MRWGLAPFLLALGGLGDRDNRAALRPEAALLDVRTKGACTNSKYVPTGTIYGSGDYGAVIEVQRKGEGGAQSEKLALKIISAGEDDPEYQEEMLDREVAAMEAMADCSGDGVLTVKDTEPCMPLEADNIFHLEVPDKTLTLQINAENTETDEDDKTVWGKVPFAFVMPAIPGGRTLHDWARNQGTLGNDRLYDWNTCFHPEAELFESLVTQLQCIHDKAKYIHGDFKGQNIFVVLEDNPNEYTMCPKSVHVADFGFAVQIEKGQLTHGGYPGSGHLPSSLFKTEVQMGQPVPEDPLKIRQTAAKFMNEEGNAELESMELFNVIPEIDWCSLIAVCQDYALSDIAKKRGVTIKGNQVDLQNFIFDDPEVQTILGLVPSVLLKRGHIKADLDCGLMGGVMFGGKRWLEVRARGTSPVLSVLFEEKMDDQLQKIKIAAQQKAKNQQGDEEPFQLNLNAMGPGSVHEHPPRIFELELDPNCPPHKQPCSPHRNLADIADIKAFYAKVAPTYKNLGAGSNFKYNFQNRNDPQVSEHFRENVGQRKDLLANLKVIDEKLAQDGRLTDQEVKGHPQMTKTNIMNEPS